MNQDDDIIRMAREACPYTTDEMRGAFYEGFLKGTVAEREACAKVCEALRPFGPELALQKATAEDCAASIRARGQK